MGRFSLDNFCGGALRERVELGLAQISRNIMDPNTQASKARTLTVKISMKPDESRRAVGVSVATNITLAPPEADSTMMLIGQDMRTGRIEMAEMGNEGDSVRTAVETLPVRAEMIPPERGYSPDTGEILGNQKPINLRGVAE